LVQQNLHDTPRAQQKESEAAASSKESKRPVGVNRNQHREKIIPSALRSLGMNCLKNIALFNHGDQSAVRPEAQCSLASWKLQLNLV